MGLGAWFDPPRDLRSTPSRAKMWVPPLAGLITKLSAGPPEDDTLLVRTTVDGDNRYAYLVGTSMATPQVAALAALIRSVRPSMPVDRVAKIIKLTADGRGDYGRGLTWLHGVTFVVLLAAALRDVSVGTSTFWWLTVIPFVAILSGNTRLGVAQGAIVVAYAVAAFWREPAPVSADAERLSVRLHLAVVLSTTYACAYLALATMWRRELQQALQRASQAATAEVSSMRSSSRPRV